VLQRPQRADQRVQQHQQDQRDVLVELQLAVAGAVSIAAHLVQRRQQRQQLPQRLDPAQLRNCLPSARLRALR
jgi:hypothetical protein